MTGALLCEPLLYLEARNVGLTDSPAEGPGSRPYLGSVWVGASLVHAGADPKGVYLSAVPSFLCADHLREELSQIGLIIKQAWSMRAQISHNWWLS